mgnify:CR=1 FL=1
MEIRVEQKGNRVKREKYAGKKIHDAATGNRTRDLSITDQMSFLTNQVHLKIQFRLRFDQKCPFTDSLHRLGSRFARTSSVSLDMKVLDLFNFLIYSLTRLYEINGLIKNYRISILMVEPPDTEDSKIVALRS